MDTYQKLRQALEAIPFVDDHSHVLHHNIEPAAWEGPYEVLPLSRLLLDFNTRSCFTSCGFPEQTVSDILLGHVEPAEQTRLLTGAHAKNRTAYRYLMRGLRKLYGLDVWEINAENWDRVNAALAHSRDDFYGLLDRTFTGGGIKCSVLNLWAGKSSTYLTDYAASLTDREKALDRKYFVFSFTVDYRAIGPFSPLAEAYAKDFGMKLDTLADYQTLLEKICRWAVEEKDVRAFKITEMYFRRLDYQVRSYGEAAPCYKPERTDEESRILSDYVACTVFRMAAKYRVPVQIHTGNIWGGFEMQSISPEHLAPVISAFPDTKFDLLHGGDPYFGVMALLGPAFPNVYLNLSSMPSSSHDSFRHWLSIFLDRVPSCKISLGWDEFAPEAVAASAPYTRDVVAAVLAEKVDSGLYSYDLALEVAEDIMHRTAENLFHIR